MQVIGENVVTTTHIPLDSDSSIDPSVAGSDDYHEEHVESDDPYSSKETQIDETPVVGSRSVSGSEEHVARNLRQRRWLDLLKDYDMSVLYHPNKENVVADSLSRLSMGSVSHVEKYKKEFVRDVHRLARLSVRLVDLTKGSTGSGMPIYEPYHGQCEGPRTVKSLWFFTWAEVCWLSTTDTSTVRHQDHSPWRALLFDV
ncbi:hypothetical protein MTR67_039601 [Solanum verrucosum]|uniref:Uncharacterized protein n=1 Tax=Solanum verrucosum TaxID=315347 RepID=A0AAF0ZP10_SOLVR|nr:hypothetical protein MTR67_039601 [Solanum verrucosum]